MSKERKEEIDKLVKELEEGVTKIFEADFVKYLDFISKFHNYSFDSIGGVERSSNIHRELENWSYDIPVIIHSVLVWWKTGKM